MADNLSVSVTADTSELRAQLALAQADLKAFGAETRKLATDIRGGGDASGVLRSQLEQVAGQFNRAKSEVGGLTNELKKAQNAHNEHAGAIKKTAEELQGLTAPISGAIGGFREIAEVAGVAFAVEKIAEFAKEMGELGERTLNMAAAVGTSVEKYSLLTGAISLAGGDAEGAGRTLERLGRNIQEALVQPTGNAARAFQSLGISAEELRAHGNDLNWAVATLAEKFTEFGNSTTKTADFLAVAGRGFDQLAGIFRHGKEGLEELKQAFKDTGAALDADMASKMAETGHEVNTLSAAMQGLSIAIYGAAHDSIDGAVNSLTHLVEQISANIREGGVLTGVVKLIGAEFDGLAKIAEFTASAVTAAFTLMIGAADAFGRAIAAVGAQLQALKDSLPEALGGLPSNQARIPPKGGGATFAGAAEALKKAGDDAAAVLDKTFNGWIDQAARAAAGEAVVPAKVRGEGGAPPPAWAEKAKKGGKAGKAPAAEKDDTEQRELARLTTEEKVDDAVLDRRTKLIEATYAAGKISLNQETALLVEQLDKKWALEQDYFAKKKAAAQGDDKELQKLTDQELIAYQTYLTKRQDLDTKYFEAKKAAEQKSAADSKAALDKALAPIEKGFDQAIQGFLQGTQTLQQALQKGLQAIILEPLIENLKNGLKSALSSAFNGSDIQNSLVGKFFSGTLLGGGAQTTGAGALGTAATTAAAQVTAFGTALSTATAALTGHAAVTGVSSTAVGTNTVATTVNTTATAANSAAESAGGVGGFLGGLPLIGGLFKGLGSLLAFAQGGIVPSAAGGWAVPSLGSGGVLSILHSREMVLPAGVSQFVQSAAASAGGGNNINLTYSPTMNGPGAFATRAQAETFFRQHGDIMVGQARNLIRNGWRP
jgi:ABC-type transporter Mla subunit MlaD